MNRYETIYAGSENMSDEGMKSIGEKVKNIIGERNGKILKFDIWGKEPLAYHIGKNAKGIYVLVEYIGDGSIPKEIERSLHLTEGIIRYLTIKVDDEVDLNKIEIELEEKNKVKENTNQDLKNEGRENENRENNKTTTGQETTLSEKTLL